jgi:hypothetical protein
MKPRFSFGSSGWRGMIKFQAGEFEDDDARDRADSNARLVFLFILFYFILFL